MYSPEEIEKIKIPGDLNWPPTDGRTDAERIAPHPWSEQARTGGEFQVHTKPGAGLGDEFGESQVAPSSAAEHILPAEAMRAIEKGAGENIHKELANIFHYTAGDPSKVMELEAWQDMKDMPAKDIFEGKFGKHFSLLDDQTERERYLGVQKYVEELSRKGKTYVPEGGKMWVDDSVSKPQLKETVAQYIQRLELVLNKRKHMVQ